jgi:hypothetical protein
MTQTLWGETKPRRRRRRSRQQRIEAPYSITGTGNDCEIIGHTEGHRDLAGCTVCLDCGVKIFCRQCVPQHPTDPNAVAILCSLHEESQVGNAI